MFTLLNLLLAGCLLVINTNTLPVTDNSENYIIHRECFKACGYASTCLYKNNAATCLTSSCPRSCSIRKNPVCGSDGETYLNKCLLRMRNCHVVGADVEEVTIVSRGECPTVRATLSLRPDYNKCNYDCTKYGDKSVCASDGNTYKNLCQMARASCVEHQHLTFKHYGPCRENECSHVRCPWGQVCKPTNHRGPTCVCNSDCPAKANSVCAQDGKSYYNQCHLDAENCLTGENNRKMSNGHCNAFDERKRRIHRASVAFSPE